MEKGMKRMSPILSSRRGVILSVILLAQASLFYGFSRHEYVPSHTPLDQFSLDNTNWNLVENVPIDQDVMDILKPDDLLSREYQNTRTGDMVNLFVAYFKTQRTGKTPHSPKNCLPGSGWTPSQSGMMQIPIPGRATPIQVNRYVVSRGQNQSLVLYWYEAHNRVIASEYKAKIYTVLDSIRYNRSDTSLVRVVVGVNNGDVQGATQTAESFVQAFFDPLKQFLPT
jgi:EpsI family protein